MNIKLFIQAIIKYIFGVLIVGSLLFIPANSFEYWNIIYSYVCSRDYFNDKKSRIIKKKIKC